MFVQLEDPQLTREADQVTRPGPVGDQLLVEVVRLSGHHQAIGLIFRWSLDRKPGNQTLITVLIPVARENWIVSMPPDDIQ